MLTATELVFILSLTVRSFLGGHEDHILDRIHNGLIKLIRTVVDLLINSKAPFCRIRSGESISQSVERFKDVLSCFCRFSGNLVEVSPKTPQEVGHAAPDM